MSTNMNNNTARRQLQQVVIGAVRAKVEFRGVLTNGDTLMK